MLKTAALKNKMRSGTEYVRAKAQSGKEYMVAKAPIFARHVRDTVSEGGSVFLITFAERKLQGDSDEAAFAKASLNALNAMGGKVFKEAITAVVRDRKPESEKYDHWGLTTCFGSWASKASFTI